LIKELGSDRIGAYKYLAPILGCNLLQAKSQLDKLPFVLKEELTKDDAEALVKKIQSDLSTIAIEAVQEEQD